MQAIELKNIDIEHLLGNWRVQSRILSKSDPAHIFATAQFHHFHENGIYKIRDTVEVPGKWSISNKDSILRTPLIQFTLPDHGTTNGIITRLICSADRKTAQLTIYLSTGLELVLIKN
jgi:hypothetical protein